MSALAAVETSSVAQGWLLADEALKAADVELLEATAVCAGKFILVLTGTPAAARAALECARLAAGRGLYLRELYLARVHPDVLQALAGRPPLAAEALGLFESYSVLQSLELADAVAKRCPVRLLDLRLGRGLGGKSTLAFCGSTAAVREAAAQLRSAAAATGLLSDVLCIPNPSDAAWRAAQAYGPGHAACASCQQG